MMRSLKFLGAWMLAAALPLAAQSYQTEFARVDYDRSRAPETIHADAKVDGATGAVNFRLPLGPGIGARGAVFQPALTARFSSFMFQTDQYSPPASAPPFLQMPPNFYGNYSGMMAWEGQYTGWTRYVHSGSASLAPGGFNLLISNAYGGKMITNWNLPDGASGNEGGVVPPGTNALSLLQQSFGYDAAWRVAEGPYYTNTDGTTSTKAAYVKMGSGDELVVALAKDGTADALIQIADLNVVGRTWSIPRRMVVIRGDVAVEFTYANHMYGELTVPFLNKPGWNQAQDYSKHPLRSAHYVVSRILNRFGDEIRFDFHPGGSGNGVNYVAKWVRAGVDTGVSVSLTYQGGITLSSSTGVLDTGQSTTTGSAFKVAYTGGTQGSPSYTLQTAQLGASDGWVVSDSGTTFPVRDMTEDWDYAIRNLQPFKVIQDQTGETVGFSYAPYADMDGLSSAWLLSKLTYPGREIRFTWAAQPFYFNANPNTWGGWQLDPAKKTAQAWGVTTLADAAAAPDGINYAQTRTYTYTRHLPVADVASGSSNTWLDTTFTSTTTFPDGSVEATIYVSPLNGVGGGPTDTLANQLDTLSFLKHDIREVRKYKAGDYTEADLSKTAETSAAYLITRHGWNPATGRYDLRDVRRVGNPSASDLAKCTEPYATVVETFDRLKGLKTTETKADWDTTALGWRTSKTEIASLSTGTVQARRGKVATLQSDFTKWFLHQATREDKITDWADSTAHLLSLAGPSADVPATTRTFDSATGVVRTQLSRDAAPQAQVAFTYLKDETGLGQDGGLLRTAKLVDPTNANAPAPGATYSYEATRGSMTTIQLNGVSWTLQQSTDGLGWVQWQKDANVLQTLVNHDAAGRITAIDPPGTEAATTFTPDTDNLGVTVTRSGQSAWVRYNGYGQKILDARQNADGTWSHKLYGYDTMGRAIGETPWLSGKFGSNDEVNWGQPNFNTTSTRIIPGHYQCRLWQADPDGNMVCVDEVWVDDTPVTSQPIYDPSQGQATRLDYSEPYGRLTYTLDLNGDRTDRAYTYGTPIETVTVHPGGADLVTKLEKDPLGRLVKITDAKNQVTEYFYDHADRITKVIQWAGAVGAATKQERYWVYDSLGRLVVLDQPESGVTYYAQFTLAGKPQKTVYGLARGWRPAGVDTEDTTAYTQTGVKTLTTTYDLLSRVTAVSSSDGSVSQTFVYGESEAGHGLANGKLVHATSNGIERLLDYNGLNGRLSGLTRKVDGLTFTQSLAYDTAYGLLTQRTYPDGKVQKLDYVWDKGLPKSTGFGAAPTTTDLVASLVYDPTTWAISQINWANAASTSCAYRLDQTGLKAMTHSIPGQLSKTWTYSYDGAGRLLNDTEDWYGYDELGRLTSAYVRDPWNANTSQGIKQGFAYDAFGNRAALTSVLVTNWTAGQVPPATPTTTAITDTRLKDVQTYSFGSNNATLVATNQLPAATTSGAATGALYDAQGNLTRIYRWLGDSTSQLTLGYDALGRVSSLGDAKRATTETYGYDDEGLRIKVVDSATGKVKYNLYNEARQLIAQYEKVGTAALAWKKDVVYVGTKEVAEVDATGTAVTLVDHLGSPRYSWKGSGAPLKQKFLPFGENLDDATSLAAFGKGFTNHEQTDPTGLVYMQARFYLPMYGRFGSPDPARDQHFEQTQSWNIFSYVQNDPTMKVDPDGRFMHILAGAGIGAVLGAGVEGWRQVASGQFSGRRLLAAAAGGAVAGGLAAATGGTSLLATAGTGALAGAAGGTTARLVAGEKVTAKTVAQDAAVGAIAGVAVHGARAVVGKIRAPKVVTAATEAGPGTGLHVGAGDPPTRVQGPWTTNDLARAAQGKGPLDFVSMADKNGRPMPLELHHGDQMPGAAIHELDAATHRQPGVHGQGNQGVTGEMRKADTQLHWLLRGKEMGG